MKKLFAMMLAVLTVVGCFAGCSSEADPAPSTQAPTTAAPVADTETEAPDTTAADVTTAPADTTEAVAATTEAVVDTTAASNGVVTVGYTIYAPQNYLDEDGTLIGFDTELAQAVFGNMGYEVFFQEIDWTQKYTDLESGAIDCVWNGFTANTADDDGILRSEKVDFSYNYMENRQVVVAKAGTTVTAENMSEMMIAVEAGSAGQTFAGTFEGAYIKDFLKQTDCLFEVLSGNVDVAILDAQLAKSYVGKGDYADLVIVEGVESDVEFYAIGFAKGSELTEQVNAQLVALAEDGTIAALAEKYGVSNTAITDFSDQQ